MKQKLFIHTSILMLSLLFITSCEKIEDDSEAVPKVNTNIVSHIEAGTALCGGAIEEEGTSSINAKGVCWSTVTGPTINDSKTTDGEGTSDFSSLMTCLNANTTYYVRAYATNNAGTGYGLQKSFTTLSNQPVPCPCSPAANLIVFSGVDNTFFNVTAGTAGLNYGATYGITGEGMSSTLQIEFSHVPVSGKFITTNNLSFIGPTECLVDGLFGSILANQYIGAPGDTVYVTKTGEGQYSASFCSLQFNSGGTSYIFTSDGNLTTN